MMNFRKVFNYVVAIILSLCVVCIVGALGVIASGDALSTPTPAPSSQPEISTIVLQTSSAAQTQTLIAVPFTSTPFIFSTPSMISVTLAPTWTEIPTITPFSLATQQLTVPAGGGEVCSCAGDTLNCGDFSTQNSSQACMDYCKAQGVGDIHNLDGDANGLACEGLQ